MVTDRQVKRLWRVLSSGKTLAQAADKANMDEKTARKYREFGRLPGEVVPERTWRTRQDPFAEIWAEVFKQLEQAPGLGVKRWRATAGPAKEVFFKQVHHPGRLVLQRRIGIA